jgi:rhamnopyranosyl-N-acetylglucosaminyl-diphospho-decaprenol beta-1,3/1,4-galactofuranosyltransferase
MRNPSIAAIFATMNRKSVALACIQSLAQQTRPPDLVVVADNVSSDGTADALENLSSLPFPLVVHRMKENRGSAGGTEEVMEIAFARQADAVWILDDDSWPRPDALQKLLDIDPTDDEVIHPIQIDPKTNDLTWPMQVHSPVSGWTTVHSLREIGHQSFVVTRNNWTGSLVPRSVRKKVGPVMGDLFIRGEDEEYPWRFQQAGISQRAALASILDHPGPPELQRTSLLGKTIYFETGLSDWKLYYKVRNMVWLQRRKRGTLAALALFLSYLIIVSRHDGAHRTPLLLEAASDGLRSRLGRWHKHPR